MKTDKTITVNVKLDKKTFRGFALYDAFVIKKRGIRPAVFCLIMAGFAAAAVVIGNEQSGLIAGVLLAVGFGLPAIYILSFLGQVNAQADKFRLSSGRKVYTVILDDEGVTVQGQSDDVLRLKWQEVTGVYRRRRCVYLYADKSKAFLLPAGQSDVTDEELWEFIAEHSSLCGKSRS